MRSYEIKPTYKNLLETFCDDCISRNIDILRFIEILNSVNDSMSIALDGAWGSGKTFFVKQTKLVLDSFNDHITTDVKDDKALIQSVIRSMLGKCNTKFQPQVCVYYDSWENDNDKDPVLSLVYSILQQTDTDYSFTESEGCIKKAASILEFFSGRNWTDVVEIFKGSDPLSELRANKNIEVLVKDFLDSLLAERGERLVVFIDELDRCNPAFAVRLLERIKHYFSNDRITFVFSINTNELQHTIKQCYGNDFNACRYLDRFFDLRVSLSPANLSNYYHKLKFNNSRYTYDIVCHEVIKKYHFEMREISRYLMLTRIAGYKPTHESNQFSFNFSDGKARQFCLMCLIPIMLGLEIADSTKYNNFINGEDYTPLIEMSNCLKVLLGDSLLSNNEVYEKPQNDEIVVAFEEKMKQVYYAIFVNQYSGSRCRVQIGDYSFEKGLRETLLKTVSLLSNYADYENINGGI